MITPSGARPTGNGESEHVTYARHSQYIMLQMEYGNAKDTKRDFVLFQSVSSLSYSVTHYGRSIRSTSYC